MCMKTAKEMKSEVIVVPGAEIRTEIGDVTGLFLDDEIRSKDFSHATTEIRAVGGVVILPHPFRRKIDLSQSIMKECDAVEVVNGRSSEKQNFDSYNLAANFDKPMIAGSDAHFGFEIGKVAFSVDRFAQDEEGIRQVIMDRGKRFYFNDSCVNSLTERIMKLVSTLVENFRVSANGSLSNS